MKKKILAVLLACALAAGSIVSPVGIVTVRAEDEQENVTEDGFRYVEFGEGIIVTSYTGSEEEVVIPDSIEGKKVIGIGDYAFRGCSGLTSINIPSGVTSIGDSAFSGCSGLTSINIPFGVTSIGMHAFRECSGLTSVSIPSSVTSIEGSAFSGCSSLADITLPENLTSIGSYAFNGTPWLADQFNLGEGLAIVNHVVIQAAGSISGSITIPPGVTGICDWAFGYCQGLSGITIPGSVTSIGDGAFYYCDGLSGITISDGVTSIGNWAFYYCSSLSSITIPDSVTSIGKDTFHYCSSLSSITISDSVTSIGDEAFYLCSSLSSITIPDSVTSIGDNAFWGCSLKDVYYAGRQEQWKQIEFDSEKNYNLQHATIHYNSTGPENSQKATQSVTANDITKTFGEPSFFLGAKSSVGAALSYVVSNPNVATVDGSGNVTIKGCGITDITITAAETSVYAKAQKVIKLTVKPKKMTLTSVKSKKKKTAIVKWKKDKTVSGYLVECATDKKFKKNIVKVTVSKNKTVSTTVKKLKAGKKYYVRICAYAESGTVKVQGDWSKAKTVKVKK